MQMMRINTVALLTLLALTDSVEAQTAAGRVPPLAATDLNGRELRVPQDLGGPQSLWIIPFEQDQRPQVDRLFALIDGLRAPGLSVWEVPVIEDPGSVVRYMINTGMKSAISSEAKRARVVTLFVADQGQWRRAAGFPSKDQAVLAIVASDGRVLSWRPHADIKDAASLKAFLAAAAKLP
jgi:hypothetical protein